MLRKIILTFCLSLILIIDAGTVSAAEYKLSVFNFVTRNLESSGLGTTVTNSLISTLKTEPSISLLDRKDLETFLSLNDLQQNDQLDNVVNIGTRLGLDFIIVGSVEKRGSAINVNCSMYQIERKKEVYNTRVRAMGEAALSPEIAKLGSAIIAVLNKEGVAGADTGRDKSANSTPVNFQKIPGNKKITLRWQDSPGFKAAGFEVYRALNKNGPFAMIGQTDRAEYVDQDVENNTVYFYKVRAFDKLSRQGEFTEVLSASPDFAPNPPIIFKTEGRARSVLIVWVPSPSKSMDNSALAGYKVYRSKTEDGIYQEISRLAVRDLSGNGDGKIYYRDKELTDGTTFFYRVVAFNEKNIESELCHPVKGATLPVIKAVGVQNDLIREVILKWAGVQSPFVAGYNIYRSLKKDGGFARIKKINAAEVTENFSYSDLDGLGDKTNYYYYVTLEDDLGIETGPSPVSMAVTRGIPPPPEKFAARGGLVKKIELTWMAAKQEEVLGYNIYWSPDKKEKYVLLKKISGRENNTYLDDSRGYNKLEDNKTYYYLLTAYNKVDAESIQAEASATTKPRPQKPAGLKGISLQVKEVPLEWQANPEKDISVYYIYRSGSAKDDFDYIAKAEKAAYIDKNLKDGFTYRYRIQAEDKDGLLSDYSEIISVKTKPRPSSPQSVAGRYEGGKAMLSWAANKESDIDHYIVYEKGFMSADKIAEVKTTSYDDVTIAKGKNKTYIITAVDKSGLESEKSEEITVSAK